MPSRPQFPAQTLLVLEALCDQPAQWQDRSALAVQTRLAPEWLHPILAQLAADGLTQIARPDNAPPGQNVGKRYRLTDEGLATAAVAQAAAARPTG
jgi:hypothetical protein